jgi:hypothetical protein
MNASQLRFVTAGIIGLLAPVWWTLVVSNLTYLVYLWSGSPERSTKVLIWTSIYLPAFVLGLATGVVVSIVVRAAPVKGWLTFFGSLLVGAAIVGFLVGAPVEYIRDMFRSVGNWCFFIGSLLIPLVLEGRSRAG